MPNSSSEERPKKAFASFLGWTTLFLGFALTPCVFNFALSCGDLLSKEYFPLGLFSLAIICIALSLIAWGKYLRSGALFFAFTLILLLGLELGFRLVIRVFSSGHTKAELSNAGNRTYREYTSFIGHPFLGHTGRPSIPLGSEWPEKKNSNYNNLGFPGPDFKAEKPEHTLRIAALGGSTTERGYPQLMQEYLNKKGDSIAQFEVFNFGISSWTSAHSMINFLLNVVEYSPDYVIIHHGWNEDKIRHADPEVFRSDYAHSFTYFREPEYPDLWLLRTSLIYRYIQYKSGIQPEWAMLGKATNLPGRRTASDPMYSNCDELKPFRRNIKTIIDHALLHNIGVVLTTMPRTNDSEAPYFYSRHNIDQCNAIIREIATEYNDITFIDLDFELSADQRLLYEDLAHMTPLGKEVKAQSIGNVVLENVLANR